MQMIPRVFFTTYLSASVAVLASSIISATSSLNSFSAFSANDLYRLAGVLVAQSKPGPLLAVFNGVFAVSLLLFVLASSPLTLVGIKRTGGIFADFTILKLALVRLFLIPDGVQGALILFAWYCAWLCVLASVEAARVKLEERNVSVALTRKNLAICCLAMILCVAAMLGLAKGGGVLTLIRAATTHKVVNSRTGTVSFETSVRRDLDLSLIVAVEPLVIAFVAGRTLMRWALSRAPQQQAAGEGNNRGRHLALLDFLLDAPIYVFRLAHHFHLFLVGGGFAIGPFDLLQGFCVYSSFKQLGSRYYAYVSNTTFLANNPDGRAVMTVAGVQRVTGDGRFVDGGAQAGQAAAQAAGVGPREAGGFNFGSGTTGAANRSASAPSSASSSSTSSSSSSSSSSSALDGGRWTAELEAEADADSEEIEKEVQTIKRQAKEKNEKPDLFALADARKRALIRRGRRDILRKRKAEEKERAEVLAAVAAADKEEAERERKKREQVAAPAASLAAAPAAAAVGTSVAPPAASPFSSSSSLSSAAIDTPTAGGAPQVLLPGETEEEGRARRLEAVRRRLSAAANNRGIGAGE